MNVLPLEAFGLLAGGLFGKLAACKPCRADNHKTYYKNMENEKLLWTRAKARAKKFGVPFTISVEDVVVPDVCPILGLSLERATGIHADASPSLDRIVPDLGYVPGNVAVISYRANRIKNDSTPTELRQLVQWLDTVSTVG